MQSGSNYLSVCIFSQVIENIPLASLARFLKVGEITMYPRNLRAGYRKLYRNPGIEAAPPSCPTGTRGRPEMMVI
jgi:hypothetical protein